MIRRLTWLHISDFHFKARGDEFSQNVAADALLNDVPNRIAAGDSLNFVLFTGDIAFSGKQEEYERAAAFLSDLASVVRALPQRFFFVPGNHDIDRTIHRLAYSGARHELLSQSDVDRLLGSPTDLAPLQERQAAFQTFVKAFTNGQERLPTEDGLGYVAPLILGGLRVCILGLNSAWLCGPEIEEMKLVIGERQIINALSLSQQFGPQLVVATAHHPVSWLHEWDQVSVQRRLLPDVHFYHRGHLHVADVSLSSLPSRPCLSIAAGSGHTTRFDANSYNLVQLDLGSGTCAVRTFRYDANGGKYEEIPGSEASVLLHGSSVGTREELAAAIVATVPSVANHARYLSGLLVGYIEEIPARIESLVEFLNPTVAAQLAPGTITPAIEFLKLRNLLRLYDIGVPLGQRVSEHIVLITDFDRYLVDIETESPACAERLTGGKSLDPSGLANSTAVEQPRTTAFLAELRASGDWLLLEDQARRFINSADRALARLARNAMAEALMHSDQREKQLEAVHLAVDLVAEPDASAAEYLLAAGCSEVIGDSPVAIKLTEQALARWPGQSDVRTYARSLALRTGSAALRAAGDAAERGEPKA